MFKSGKAAFTPKLSTKSRQQIVCRKLNVVLLKFRATSGNPFAKGLVSEARGGRTVLQVTCPKRAATNPPRLVVNCL